LSIQLVDCVRTRQGRSHRGPHQLRARRVEVASGPKSFVDHLSDKSADMGIVSCRLATAPQGLDAP
jgi:hypothetical protein